MVRETPERRHPRLREFDYSENGAYFVTVCTVGRRNILSRVDVGRGLAPAAPACVELTKMGQIAREQLLALESRFSNLKIEKYVIMPNHIHILLVLTAAGASPRPTVPNIIGAYKSLVTRMCNAENGTPGAKIFQSSFHDHIIRDENDFLARWKYIDENPVKWGEDEYHS